MPKTATTRGEEVVEEYLAAVGRKSTYEPNIGGRQPDYLVHGPALGRPAERTWI